MLPEWCNQTNFGRFVGGQLYIINRYLDTSFRGEIGRITYNEETGRLSIAYTWFAVGVDDNNRCSLARRTGWVEAGDPIEELDLWASMGADGLMMLYIGRPVSDGRLILDGGELMEAVFTFYPPGVMTLPRDQVRAADPTNPVDRSNTYVTGRMPGGKLTRGGLSQIAFYERDRDGDPRRVTPDDI